MDQLRAQRAVRGNTDGSATATALPESLAGELGGLPFPPIHHREDINPASIPPVRLIVCGHTHRPELAWQGSCLLLNPGACGPRRFHLP